MNDKLVSQNYWEDSTKLAGVTSVQPVTPFNYFSRFKYGESNIEHPHFIS
jgi:hypothetical protein